MTSPCLMFDKQGRHLKMLHSQFGHEKNLVLCEELSTLHVNIAKLEQGCKETASLFRRVTGGLIRYTNSAHKKKNLKN